MQKGAPRKPNQSNRFNPLKLIMASRMVELYFGEAAAQAARDKWDKEATAQTEPEVMDEFEVAEPQYSIVSLIVAVGFAETNSEARRLIEQGGVRLKGVVVSDPRLIVSATELNQGVLQVGRHRFVRLTISHV